MSVEVFYDNTLKPNDNALDAVKLRVMRFHDDAYVSGRWELHGPVTRGRIILTQHRCLEEAEDMYDVLSRAFLLRINEGVTEAFFHEAVHRSYARWSTGKVWVFHPYLYDEIFLFYNNMSMDTKVRRSIHNDTFIAERSRINVRNTEDYVLMIVRLGTRSYHTFLKPTYIQRTAVQRREYMNAVRALTTPVDMSEEEVRIKRSRAHFLESTAQRLYSLCERLKIKTR